MTGLIRIIILGILFVLARNLFLKFQHNRLEQLAKKQSGKGKKVESRKTLRCDHCGIYIPAHEAIRDEEKTYCSPEHKEQYKENDQ